MALIEPLVRDVAVLFPAFGVLFVVARAGLPTGLPALLDRVDNLFFSGFRLQSQGKGLEEVFVVLQELFLLRLLLLVAVRIVRLRVLRLLKVPGSRQGAALVQASGAFAFDEFVEEVRDLNAFEADEVVGLEALQQRLDLVLKGRGGGASQPASGLFELLFEGRGEQLLRGKLLAVDGGVQSVIAELFELGLLLVSERLD